MSQNSLSTEQRIWVIKQYYQLNFPVSVQRLWRKEFGSSPPSRPTINSIIQKFETTGSVLNLKQKGNGVTVTTEEAKQQVK